jgi:hypothetical protein
MQGHKWFCFRRFGSKMKYKALVPRPWFVSHETRIFENMKQAQQETKCLALEKEQCQILFGAWDTLPNNRKRHINKQSNSHEPCLQHSIQILLNNQALKRMVTKWIEPTVLHVMRIHFSKSLVRGTRNKVLRDFSLQQIIH